ncbi:hypothetical protein [Ichthyenterobacterium magnum]|uniref:Uncharacterized protein n=1 Tax=Ichthyenterobacterium magnum TaxID=1230530 RepID=A0A420DGG9_9FLAO|nr:hypothetical protein [Ichthyenterobacterium magnum]RKE92170.1 hypothetical protein BXY80_2086 [Ichthyenterobacterium magnum]
MKYKALKYSFFTILILIIIGGIYYFNLSNRHKAIVKKHIYHKLALVDNTWNISTQDSHISLISPTLIIDNIYKSMEGPQAISPFQVDNSKDELIWLTSFKTQVLDTNETNQLSNDFICHTNINIYDGEHYSRWNLNHRIGEQYPRLTSLSNGLESFKFPNGFGYPVFSNENLFLTTQTLNHNIKSDAFSVKHKVNIGFQPHNISMKPLMSKNCFVMLPYDSNNPFKGPTEANPNMCLPIEIKNHSYKNSNGESLSGHWVIFPGKATYSSNITHQLQLKDSTSMHQIITHLHPFAESLAFRDKTIDSTIFISKAENHKDRIGLKNIPVFSSEKGIMLYANHEYELVLNTNNTSGTNQDMMASIFVFLYDKEMDEKLNTYNANL